jgi:hypothetical protein
MGIHRMAARIIGARERNSPALAAEKLCGCCKSLMADTLMRKPHNRDPESPRKILAGVLLKYMNETSAPDNAAQMNRNPWSCS